MTLKYKYLSSLISFVFASIFYNGCSSKEDCSANDGNSSNINNDINNSENNSSNNNEENLTQVLKSLYLSGVAVDGLIQSANVQIGNKTTMTNSAGEWNITIEVLNYDLDYNFSGETILISGGIDSGTGEIFEGELRAFIEPVTLNYKNPHSKYLAITPISTLVSAMVDSGINFSDAKTKISKSLNINEDYLLKNPISMANSNDLNEREIGAKIIKDGLTVQKFVESMNSSLPEDQFFMLFKAVGKNISGEDNLSDLLINKSDFIADEVAKSINKPELFDRLKAVGEISKSTVLMINEMDSNLLINGGDGWKAVESATLKIEDEIKKFKDFNSSFSDINQSALEIANGLIVFGGIDRIALEMKSADLNLSDLERKPSNFSTKFLDSDILKDGGKLYDKFKINGFSQIDIFKLANDRYRETDFNLTATISSDYKDRLPIRPDENILTDFEDSWKLFDNRFNDKFKPKDHDDDDENHTKPEPIAPKVFISASKLNGTTEDYLLFEAISDNPATIFSWFIDGSFYGQNLTIEKKFIEGIHNIKLIGSVADKNGSISLDINITKYIKNSTSDNNTTQILKSLYLSGVAVDGEISGANVNVLGKKATTDSKGKWQIEVKENEINSNVQISVSGGIDQSTGEIFEGELKAVAKNDSFSTDQNDTNSSVPVTPLSTLVSAMVNSGSSLEDAKNNLAKSLGFDADIFDKNPVELLETGSEEDRKKGAEAIKTALMIQKMAETMTKSISTDESQNNDIFSKIMSGIASTIAESNGTLNIDEVLKNSDKIAENSVSDPKMQEKLKIAGASAQSIVSMINEIDTNELSKGNISLETVSKATEIATSKIEQIISKLAKTDDLTSVKAEAEKVTNALIMLGGVNGLSTKIVSVATSSTDDNFSIDASDFSNFLNDDVINTNANLYEKFKDLNVSSDDILKIGAGLSSGETLDTLSSITGDINISSLEQDVKNTISTIDNLIPKAPKVDLASNLVSEKVGNNIKFTVSSDQQDILFKWFVNEIYIENNSSDLDYKFLTVGNHKVKVIGTSKYGLSSTSNILEIVISALDDNDSFTIGNNIHIGSKNYFETDRNLSNSKFDLFSVKNENQKSLTLVNPELAKSLFHFRIPLENKNIENETGKLKVSLMINDSNNSFIIETENFWIKNLNNNFSIITNSDSAFIYLSIDEVRKEQKYIQDSLYIENNMLVIKLSDYLSDNSLLDSNYKVNLDFNSSFDILNNTNINGEIEIKQDSANNPLETPSAPSL